MTHIPTRSRKFLYISVCIGNLVAFSVGITLGWSSPINAKLKDETKIDENPFGQIITDEQDSWISSLLPFGALFGSILSGFVADRFGRKRTLIFGAGFPLLVSFVTLAFARHIILYYCARFLAGGAYGVYLTVLPNFNSEISEVSIRGMLVSSINVFEIPGPLYSYAIGPYASIMLFNVTCAVFPALFIILFFLFVPESPYYLVAIGDSDGAMESLRKFRQAPDSNLLKEYEIIRLSIEESKVRRGTFFDIFKSKGWTKALIISTSLVVFQQFSGINVVVFNTQTIFDATGSNFSSEISSMMVGAVQIVASFSAPILVDRLGRKMMLTISAVGMVISEVPLGLYFYLYENGTDVSNISWLPVTCLMSYIMLYNFGFGILPWTVMAEVFPPDVKSAGSTATACVNWTLAFTLTKFFTSLNVAIGMSGAFWLFSGFCVMAIPFLIFYMIETKNKTFQEIQDILAK